MDMETLSARHSSHHDCPFISFELSMGQMVKWVDRRQRREQWAQRNDPNISVSVHRPEEYFKSRAFVKDRLAAAALEIFQVFEKTIEKYEEEASSSKQEIERLRGLLLEFESNHKQDLSQSSTPPGQHHCQREEPGLSTDQRDQDLDLLKRKIKSCGLVSNKK
ncbi:hypothetical protein INR49_014970 [Caranx melampygus]|nr:hypothetical protein INR49_014970 [Caranx melampygus]